jgi:hypothetical protein
MTKKRLLYRKLASDSYFATHKVAVLLGLPLSVQW